tara:strand:+ start:226 stop:579 length:354 start_codon:yes stop_codon:yes gene_type:complete
MFDAIRKYAVFSGRARRKEYWLFSVFYIGLIFVMMFTDVILGTYVIASGFGVLGSITVLGLLLPSISVLVRRLHDADKSGWWVLLGFVPLGGLILLVFCCMDGTKGENRFGPDPKAE